MKSNVWETFLESVLEKKQLQSLRNALAERKPVYFYGAQGVGKTKLVNALRKLGYEASEPGQPEYADISHGPYFIPEDKDYECFEMKVIHPVKIPNLYSQLVSHPDELNDWITCVLNENNEQMEQFADGSNDGIVENITQETIDCVAQHIKAFHEQDACGKVADFGEPCATCKHIKECGFDWLAKMKPLLDKSDVIIQLYYSGHLRKPDNCQQ